MIDKEYQSYIEEQPLKELKKIALRINKMHFPEEFKAIVKKIEELEGSKFDKDFYYNEKMKDALHLEIKEVSNAEERIKKSKRILATFLIVFSAILSINVYNLLINQNLLSIIPVIFYVVLIVLDINQSKFFGSACKIWAVFVMILTLLINFKDLIGITNRNLINVLNALIGSNEIIQPSIILLTASILIFIYADHINFDENDS